MKHDLIQNQKSDYILLHGKKEIVYLMLKDILYIQADDHYSIFHMKNGKRFVSCYTLKHFEKLLGESHFFRINRSYIINKNYIKSYSFTTRKLLLLNNTQLLVSFRKQKVFINTVYGDYNKLKAMVV